MPIRINPVPTRGADYAQYNTGCSPRFENLTASLNQNLHKIFCHNIMFAKRNYAWRRLYFDYDSSSFFQQKKSFYVSMYALKTPKNKNIQTRCQGHFRTRLFTRLLLDNFILIERLRQNANFSSLVCSIALFCLFHVGEKITYYVPAD